ncbi:MAG: DUF2905 domain-containing protein [Candidatus Omnitrophota bacterium]
MAGIGKYLILIGVILIIAGIFVFLAGKIKWLGHLPGDIFIQKKNFSFYFPLTTCILISILLSLIIWLFSKK